MAYGMGSMISSVVVDLVGVSLGVGNSVMVVDLVSSNLSSSVTLLVHGHLSDSLWGVVNNLSAKFSSIRFSTSTDWSSSLKHAYRSWSWGKSIFFSVYDLMSWVTMSLEHMWSWSSVLNSIVNSNIDTHGSVVFGLPFLHGCASGAS